jgi:hypothetical protein
VAESAIRLRGVVKRYGSITAVDGLDLDVPEGTCVGLLGPNGAGKSTTMRLLTAQAIADEVENFSYVVSAVLTPLFLVAGTFFPLNRLPGWAQFLANFNPLHHCVVLVSHAAFGFVGWTDVARVGALVLFGVVVWRIAIYAMTRKLID